MTLFTRTLNRPTFQRVLILLFMAVAIAPAAYADDVADGARAAPEPLRAARPTFEIGPIDGLTTDWHPAPAWTSIPAGTILMLHQAAQLNETVVWSGAYEFTRDEGGSTAIAILHAVGPQQISVEVAPHRSGASESFSSGCTFDVVNIRFDYISVSPIVVDVDPPTNDSRPDVAEPTEPSDPQEFTDDESQFGGSGGAGDSGDSGGSAESLVLLEVDVNPPGFAPLMEWRLDDQPAVLGPAVLMRAADIELSMVEVGPVFASSTLQSSSDTASANAPGGFAGNRIAAPHGGSSPSPQPASGDDDKRSHRDLPNDPAEAGGNLWDSDDDDIYNNNSGNVGIGTMEPDVRLHVVNDLGVVVNDPESTYEDKAIAEIKRGAPETDRAGLQLGYVADGQRDPMAYIKSLNKRVLRIGTTDSPAAVAITNSGNVGIGTTTPVSKLVVEEDAGEAPLTPLVEIRRQEFGAGLAFGYSDEPGNRKGYVRSLGTGALSLGTFNTPEALAIKDSNGNVGIGVQDPAFKLDVRGDADTTIYAAGATPQFRLQANGRDGWIEGERAPNDWFAHKFIAEGPDGLEERMRITGDGNVGIGTTGPTRTLQVGSTTSDQNLVFFDSASPGSAHTVLKVGHTQTGVTGINMLEVATDTDGDAGGETTRFLIRNDGNVGIGTTSPTSTLTVNGVVESTSGGFKFPNGSVQTAAGVGGGGTSGRLAKFTDAATIADSLLFDNGSAVGIGTTSPFYNLDVRSDGETTIAAIGAAPRFRLAHAGLDGYIEGERFGDDPNTSFFAFKLFAEGPGDDERMRITGDGRVGIGTTNPQGTLDVQGPIFAGSLAGRAVMGSDGNSNAGAVLVDGSNGIRNAAMKAWDSDSTHGMVQVYDTDGVPKAAMWVNDNNDGCLQGSLLCLSIDPPGPDNPAIPIVYSSPAGPEAAAYVRGTGHLVDGEAVVLLPQHFATAAIPEGMTVQLTPLSADSEGLAVVEKSPGKFVVRELRRGVGTYDFDYTVMAVRKGYEDYEVIRPIEDVPFVTPAAN